MKRSKRERQARSRTVDAISAAVKHAAASGYTKPYDIAIRALTYLDGEGIAVSFSRTKEECLECGKRMSIKPNKGERDTTDYECPGCNAILRIFAPVYDYETGRIIKERERVHISSASVAEQRAHR